MGVSEFTETIWGTGLRTDEPELSQEDVFDVLSNHRRISVIRYLQETEGPVELRDVVDYVTEREHAGSVGEVDYSQRKCVYTALRQTHLPKLDELGIVEYDKSRGEIRMADQAEQVRMYLEYVPENDIPWHAHYVGLTALSAGLLATTYVGIYPFDLGWAALAVILFLMFGVSAVVHTHYSRRRRLEDADFVPVED